MIFRVVTDSTCDLPPGALAGMDVTVVPCSVHFGEEHLRDGQDIANAEFYQRLARDPIHPSTSQPSVGAFLDAYGQKDHDGQTDDGLGILSLHVSSRLSGTVNSATQAKAQLQGNGPRIEVVDSLTVSLGLGILVLEAARIAQAGGRLEEAVEFLQREGPRVHAYCSVDTMKYLVRGGRASRLQGFFGTLLDIKPVIEVKDGETHPVDRVRTRKRLAARFVELVRDQGPIKALGFIHGNCRSDAEWMADAAAPYFPRERMLITEFSPVMGVHLGPGALGVALWTG